MSFSYKVIVKPQHERRATISAAVGTTTLSPHNSHDVYEGVPISLPRVVLPLNLPLYRMANGRTQTEQLAYISGKKVAADFFSAGEENEATQQIQHEILKKFALQGTDSITPVIKELSRSKQTEPLMVTASGIVVNGNRRLAAMRELYTEEQVKHPTFANIECVVLPALSAEQIDDIEIRLQMRPEVKLPYGWIDECLKIRKLLEAERKEDDVARLMRKKSGEVRKALSALSYAEIYLRDWQKSPQGYQLLEGGEQFFRDLVSQLKGKEGELLEANLRIAWMLFDGRKDLGSRIYNFNKVIGEKAKEVLEKLAERVNVDLELARGQEDLGDELDIDLGDDSEAGITYKGLIELFDNPTQRNLMGEELIAICQEIIDAGRTVKEGLGALDSVMEAHRRLIEVDLTKAALNTYAAIGKQLEEVLIRTTDLKDRLKKASMVNAGVLT